MKPHEQGIANRIGKIIAKPLSMALANSVTANISELAIAYLEALLGQGAGAGWAFDAEIKAAQFSIKTPSPILFDVGANKGVWTRALQALYPEAQFFMFEPQPGCQSILANLHISKSTLIPSAVGSANGKLKLYSPNAVSGIASLYKRRDSYFKHKKYKVTETDIVTIDDSVEKYKLATIDFMKMDIEGHELEALKGAMKSLESGVIKAFSFEFGSGNINSRTFFHDFWDLLHPLGYNIYRILPSSRLMPIKQYYEDCEHFRGVTNYIAVCARNTGGAPH